MNQSVTQWTWRMVINCWHVMCLFVSFSDSSVTSQTSASTDKNALRRVIDFVRETPDDSVRDMNRKLQRVLEETLTKNMHLQKVLLFSRPSLGRCFQGKKTQWLQKVWPLIGVVLSHCLSSSIVFLVPSRLPPRILNLYQTKWALAFVSFQFPCFYVFFVYGYIW